MGTCEGWLLLTDMDGTLLSPDGSVSKRNQKVITEFVSQGGLFGVATGRMPSSIGRLVIGLPINCPIIVCNGAGIFDLRTQQLHAARFLDLETVRGCIQDVMASFPDIGVFVIEMNHAAVLTDADWILELEPEERAGYVRKTLDEVGDDVFKLMFTGFPARVAELRRFLDGHAVAASVDMVFAARTCLELLSPKVSKGAALVTLREELGVAPERVLAIGDYDNDAEMLRAAGISAAPKNAHPDILNLVDMVVSHHGEDAVADFLDRVFWNKDEKDGRV